MTQTCAGLLFALLSFLTLAVGYSQVSDLNGVTYTTEVTVKFRAEAFDENTSASVFNVAQMSNAVSHSQSFLQKRDAVSLQKVFANSAWGDTLRRAPDGRWFAVPDLSQIYRVTFAQPVKMRETVYELRSLPDIADADPPTFTVTDLTPNDLNGQGSQWNLAKVNATAAWDVSQGSSSITVAVIDEGVDASHPDLAGKTIGGESGFYIGENGQSHGTQVAGVVGAATNNGIGIASLGWNVMIRPFNFRDGTGTASDIVTAVNQGAHVLNCSWRTLAIDPNNSNNYINYDDFSVRNAIATAVANNRVVVASAGNPPGPVVIGGVTRYPSEYPPFLQYPAAYSGVIAVSATNSSDQFPSGYNYGSHVDVSAPSISILTLGAGNTYPSPSGTSFGSPLVAALAGLIKSVNPNLAASQIANVITSSSDDLGTPGRDDYYGYGRINAANALCQVFSAQTITGLTVEPTPGGVKTFHTTVGGSVRYDANASTSPSGPFYSRGSNFTAPPNWVSMAYYDIIHPPYEYKVDTALYYWNVTGNAGSCQPTPPSNLVGTVGAWHLKSASATAMKNNNQKKIARGGDSYHVKVFESGGDIFFTRSTNSGATWLPEELVSAGNGLNSNPAIENLVYIVSPSSYHESYIVWEENPVGANGYRIWSRKRDNYGNTWGPINLLHENLSSRPTAAQPVVSGFYTFWRGPSSILWRHSGPSYYPNVYTVPGTDANSNSPSVDLYPFYGGTAHVAWEQTGAGVRYSKGNVYEPGGTNTWSQVYNIADNSGLTTNARPTVIHDNSNNACIAWEYKFLTNGSIKYRTVAPNGTMSSITTFPNPPGTSRQPKEPVLSHHQNLYDGEHLALSWHTGADGVIGVYFRSGAWQVPFVASSSGQYVHLHETNAAWAQPPKLAVFMATTGSPYRIHTVTLPATTPSPLSPVLLFPANGAAGVAVPVSINWDYAIGASSYRLQVDDNSDFSSPVIDVSGWTATSYYASLNTYTTYWWRVNATSPSGTSTWSSVWQFTTGDQLPPGCPFVYTWDGQGFVEDNNILPQSLEPSNSGVDVLDSYRLMKPLVPKSDKYTLQIREDGEDYSRFDNVALVAVDHPSYVDVAMRDDGSVVSYFKPFSLNHARLRERDVLREVSAFDSLSVDASGDFLDLAFRRFNPPGAPFVTPEWKDQSDSPLGPGDEDVVIEAGGSGGDPGTDAIGRPVLVSNGTTDGSFSPTLGARFRHNPSLVYIPLSIADTNNLQMQWPGVVTLDYVNLGVKVPARLTIRELALQRAVHDSLGVVTQALSSVDGNYAELAQGHRIELTFAAPSIPPSLKRTFFFISVGRYEHVGEAPSNVLGKTASVQASPGKPTSFALHQNYPNPFNPSTAIKYDLPSDVHVTLRVYDLLGRTVATLVDEMQQSGYHQYQFDATNIASGVYFYSMKAGEFSTVKKLLLLR